MEVEIKHYKTFRYEVYNASPDVTTVLYVLHGYGQLAKYFIRKFKELPENIMIVAPEGMHRFYLNGTSGKVGASWMTKEARETDISDSIDWLDHLHEQIKGQYTIKKQLLLGFSQGGATAARWETLGNVKFDGLILWACVFPPDIEIKSSLKSNIPSYFAIGSNDVYYSADNQRKLIDYYEDLGYNITTYVGKHDIHNETLTKIIRQIN